MPPAAFPAPGEPDTLYLVDLSSMVRGRWGAIEPPPDDVHDLQVVISMCQWLRILIAEVQPARVVFAADVPGPTWHQDLWPDFHRKRVHPGPGYDAQLGRIAEILELHRLPVVSAPGFLADDVIATLTKQARREGLRVVVVSRDHDLWFLADEAGEVICWDGTEKGGPIGPMEVVKRYGVLPHQLADLKALTGEDDEAPGVPTIGEKTAAILLGRFGTLAEVLRKWQWETKGVNQKQRDALRLGGEVALLSRELVGLRSDVPLGKMGEPFDFDDAIVTWSEADAAAIRAMGEELDIGILRQAGRKRPLVDRRPPPPAPEEPTLQVDDPESEATIPSGGRRSAEDRQGGTDGEKQTPVRAAPQHTFTTDPLLLTSDHIEESFAAGLCPLCGMTMGPGLCERLGAELVCRGRARKTAAFEVVSLFPPSVLDGPVLTVTCSSGEERSLGDLAAETQARIRAGAEEHLGLEADDDEDEEGFALPPAPEAPASADDAGGPDPAPAAEGRPPPDGDPTLFVHGAIPPWEMTTCGLVVAEGIQLYSNAEGMTCPACGASRPFRGESFGLWAAPPTNIAPARLRAAVMDVLTYGGRGGWSGFPTGPKKQHSLSIAKMIAEVLGFDFLGAPFTVCQTWVEEVGDQLVAEGWAAKTHSDDANQRQVCGPLYTRIPDLTREEILALARLNPEALSKGEQRFAAAVPPHVQLPGDLGLDFLLRQIVDSEAPISVEELVAKGVDGEGFLDIGEDTTWPEDLVRAFVEGMAATDRITVVEGIVQARPAPLSPSRPRRPSLSMGPAPIPSPSLDCTGSSKLRSAKDQRRKIEKDFRDHDAALETSAPRTSLDGDAWIDLPHAIANLETGQILAKPEAPLDVDTPWQQLVRWPGGDRLKLWSLPVWQHKVTLGAPVLLTPIRPDAPPVVAVFVMTEDLPRHLTRVDPVRDSEARLYVGGAVVGLAKIPHAMIERYLLAGDPLLSTLPTPKAC